MTKVEPEAAWRLVYEGFEPEEEGLREALCALGNGYFVTRAAAPEASADDVHYPGTYLAGCYNRLVSDVEGRPVENEDLVNLPNWLPLTFRIDDGEWFHISAVTLHDYRLELDMRAGVLTRTVDFEDDAGRRTQLTERRLVHMGDKNVAALESTLVAANWSGAIDVRAALDGRVINWGVPRYRDLDGRHLVPQSTSRHGQDGICLIAETSQSRVRIAQAARLCLRGPDGAPLNVQAEVEAEADYIALCVPCRLEQDVPLTVEKTVTLFSSRERGISEAGYAACRKLDGLPGFQELLRTHAAAWDDLWRRCDLTVEDGAETERILRLHAFHTLQTVSPNSVDLDAGVGPRGLHGEAYRGHVFWDEMYIFPFFNATFPDLTRELLMYRYRRLPEARRLALEEGFSGALYPWQSGSDGREETQVVHLNPKSGRWLPDVSHLQRHVNAAIAYDIWKYWEATGDHEFLFGRGAEMLLEIARFFASLTTYNESLERYEIRGVMGPDEYHTGYPWREAPGLDNNAYTNVMAVWLLSRALQTLEMLPQGRREELLRTLGLGDAEPELWRRITRRMRIPFHDGVISQFEHYEKLREFDWKGYKQRYGNIQRLDRILESEDDDANHYRLAKQADTLMLFYLLPLDELQELFGGLGYPLDADIMAATARYYADRTSHGSTLSAIVHAAVLRHHEHERSWEFFQEALRSDLFDTQGGTTREGIHLGTMAGTVDLVKRAYLGLETHGDSLCFDPDPPVEIETLACPLRFRGHMLHVELRDGRLTVEHRPSAPGPVAVRIGGVSALLGPGERITGGFERWREEQTTADPGDQIP